MRLRRSLSLSIALAGALALAGCTSPAAEPTAWQGVVQTLASQASGGDYASALATLDQLEAEVTAQRDDGTLPAAEAEAILARIATVRADLTSLAPSPEPTAPVTESTPEPTQSTVTDDEQDAEEPEPEQPAPADPGDTGPGKSGSDTPGSGNPGPDKDDKTKEEKSKGDDAPGRSGSVGGPGKKDG